MNATCTFQEMAVEPARPDLAANAYTGDTSATQRPQESSRISGEALARTILKLTGSVRLASRSARNWHHCGINE